MRNSDKERYTITKEKGYCPDYSNHKKEKGLSLVVFNLEEYLANPRKVVTRSGRDVSIVYTDGKKIDYPSIALVDMGWEKLPLGFTKDGEYRIGEVSDCDLFFAPEKKEGWVNVFEDAVGNPSVPYSDVFTSKESAEESGKNKDWYIATAKIEWEE